MEIKKAEFLISSPTIDKCPKDNRIEYAFIGRSNVGKSSLINMLCNHKGLSKTSSTPGKTLLINHFLINDEWYLVDLPGYGFAKTGGQNREAWSKFIAEYVENSKDLALMCLLIDLRHPALPIDAKAYQWLRGLGMPLQVIGTKADKLNQQDKQKNLRELAQNYPADYPPLMYSSLKHTNRERLLSVIETFIDEEEA